MPSDQQLKHRDNYQTKHKQASTHSQTQLTLTLTVAATAAAEMAVSPSTLYFRPQLIASGVMEVLKWATKIESRGRTVHDCLPFT